MASLLLRIRELVSAQAHHSLDEMENPSVMAQQLLRDLAEDLSRANRALVSALGAEKGLQRQQEQGRADAAEWRTRCERLLAAGQEELARGAMERAMAAEAGAAEQERPLQTARQSTARLREQVARLRTEWDKARARCAQIAANHNAAAALGAASRLGDHYSQAMERAQRLDQLSRKSAAFECQAEAAAELLGEGDAFEREVAQADQRAAVDGALEQLRARMAATVAARPSDLER